ncbi:TetR/AcrR family transcriptional regulator [Gordonia sp. NB41Y]|uniref:TetR/AcrR family transcriptional regulator n=1 Tax=Gordonia sp. NB41Y TaxID=875808 RepID=UPI0002BE7A57|nr:TetR/AcrR family transcriptional regulator [Gordonia sp. NB41Y]EMP14258.1 hypothetical protein ISGA_752 [Gordonia sp. NB41Y]WLP90599.1 TetR/AcrR family transcriptional regulator [Gordonia sp. NB41Y]
MSEPASPDSAAPRSRGRGRRPLDEVRTEILQAAVEVLFDDGMAGFTIEKVAARAGASRSTVYKYWPSRGALALDGYVHTVGTQIAFRDTGDIHADLTSVLIAFARLMRKKPSGPAFAQLIGAAQTDPELAAAFSDHYFGPRRREVLALLDAARERGQIRPDVELTTIVDLLWGSCYMRILLPGVTGTLTDDFARDVVAVALAGAGTQ